jgi:ketosteroid isomerase-like protein
VAGLAEAKSKKYDEAMNNNDAAAVATFFTEDAVIVTDTGPVYGPKSHREIFCRPVPV